MRVRLFECVFVFARVGVCGCIFVCVLSVCDVRRSVCLLSKLTESQEDTRRKLFGPKVTLEIPSVGGEFIWYSCASDLDMAAKAGIFSSSGFKIISINLMVTKHE